MLVKVVSSRNYINFSLIIVVFHHFHRFHHFCRTDNIDHNLAAPTNPRSIRPLSSLWTLLGCLFKAAAMSSAWLVRQLIAIARGFVDVLCLFDTPRLHPREQMKLSYHRICRASSLSSTSRPVMYRIASARALSLFNTATVSAAAVKPVEPLTKSKMSSAPAFLR